MKLSLGNQRAVNINKVRLNRTDIAYTMNVNLEVINPTATRARTLNKSLFLFASTNTRITNKILTNNENIVSFLLRDEVGTKSEIYQFEEANQQARATRYSKNLIKGHTKRMVFDARNYSNGTIKNLTLFAGILTGRSSKLRNRYTLEAIDTLIVLQDGVPIENNLLLFTDKARDTLWLGPAYQDNLGYWYKKSLISRAQRTRLYKRLVPNTKVVYTSELDKNLLQTLGNTFEDLYNLNRVVNSKQALVNKLKTETRNYFSPLRYAKGRDHSMPLSFSFNRLDFFRNNGAFSKLIKNEQEMIGAFELLSAQIVRKRVKKNSPGSRLTACAPLKNFDNQEAVVTDTPFYLDLLTVSDIMTVAANDLEMRGITYGLYAYGVEFIFADKTRDKISSIINQNDTGLRSVLVQLERLYKTMILPDNYNVYANCLREPYRMRYEVNDKKDLILNAIKSYVSAISLFHKELATAIKSTPNTLADKLFALSDPMTNGPEGVAQLSQLILDLIKQLERHAQTSTSTNDNVAKNSAVSATQISASRLGLPRRILKVKHYFKEIVDADSLIESGFDYLTVDNEYQSTFQYHPYRTLSYAQLENVVAVERTKYNNLATTRLDAISLTPNYFLRPGVTLPVNTPSPNQFTIDSLVASSILVANKYKNSPADLSQFNVLGNTTETSTNVLSVLNNNLKIMEKENCTVSINLNENSENIFESHGSPIYLKNDNDYLDASEKLSEQSPFVINKTGSVSLGNFLLNTFNNVTQEQYYNTLQNLNSDVLSYLIQTDYFLGNNDSTNQTVKNLTDSSVFRSRDVNIETLATTMQNDVDAKPLTAADNLQYLLLGQEPPDFPTPQEMNYLNFISSPVSASQITQASLKYGTVRKIQYFAGFRKLNDSVMMNKPIWITLTTANAESFSQSGKTILCRMKESTSQFSNYAGIDNSLYDETFLISPKPPLLTFSPRAASSPEFSILSEENFASMENASDLDYDILKYSTSIASGPLTNNNGGQTPVFPKQAQSKNKPLYTNGGDFLLPNGEYYVGHYHLFYVQQQQKYIAMAGRSHRGSPHSTLRASSTKARRILREAGSSPPASTNVVGSEMQGY